ncbi:MAG: S9 family peptidase [Flavobacteriia bacterium]|nr:S9 family peptidase [Flavobacteriia bacterium]
MKGLFIFILASLINFSYSQISKENSKEITVEDIWKNGVFRQKSFPGFNSMNDGEHFTKINQSNTDFTITKHSFKDYKGQGEILVTKKDLMLNDKFIEVDDYSFNADETKLLIQSKTESIYRRSYYADFYILDLKTKQLTVVDDQRKEKTLAEFSPDGTMLAYVSENNLFVKDLNNLKIKQLTFDGKKNEIINGTTDWVYEEEFAITKGFEWSPDSKMLAFLRFDESKVKEFQMAMYGGLYPEQYLYKYPKAGEDNSKVSCHIVNISSAEIIYLNLGEYEYIPRLKWSNSEPTLIIQTLNRHQNHLKYHKIEMATTMLVNKVFFEEKSDTYVEIDDNLIILSDGKSLLRTSESSGFNHIHRVYFDGKTQQITDGNWDIIEFLGINEKKATIYYSAAEKNAIFKGLYKIDLNGKNKKAISKETGYNSADFSSGMKYFMKSYSDANTPRIFSLCTEDGKEIAVLEDNKELAEKMKSYGLSSKEFMQIKGTDELLNASIIRPPNFDPSKKYPVYVTIYGGPGSNTVTDDFDGNDYFYHQLLAQKGYIVFSVDPHGTMYRGAKFKKSTYLQLGKLETEDFIAVAKNFNTMPEIDMNRIGIQGWSYGGYMTSLAMTKGAEIFKMGIAVAPVTNWRYYDNIYTERFMRTPQENPKGYDDNSPINFVKNIKGKYMIIHGSADDNVHYQNTMEMINALTKANIQFDMFIYPNKNHGIYGGNTRNHLFNMMLNYTLKNL